MCGVGSLFYDSGTAVDIKPTGCRSWTCDVCGPIRQARCEIHAQQGQPNRFLTLTCRPRHDQTPTERRKIMGKAFAALMKRWERHTGEKPEFYAVTEQTKRGEPHLHVLMRSRFVSQRLISRWWQELTGWRIVDIRMVKGKRQAAKYVAKYLGKGLARFGTCKRYWSSRAWLLPAENESQAEPWTPTPWRWVKDDIDRLELSYRVAGWWLVPGHFRGDVRHLMWRLSGPSAPPRPPRM